MIDYAEEEIILQAENISLDFGEKSVLRDVNFTIRNITRPNISQGQVVSLIGRSGIGKTQLFKICAGLNAPTKGTVKVGALQAPVKSGDVGIVPQNYILFSHRTIQKNLLIALDHSGQKLDDAKKLEIVLKYAHDFELEEHLPKYPAQLSGGQKQRVSILQQILAGNKFLLLDEPFSGLDVVIVEKVINLLVRVSLLDELNTLIIVSHDIQSSMAISDMVWVIAKEEGKPGATIVETVDLKKEGLAWREGIQRDPKFQDMVHHVKKIL